jgi:hypothetical protein
MLYANSSFKIRSLRAFYYGRNFPTGFLPVAVDHHHINGGFTTPRLANYFTIPKKIIRMRVRLKKPDHRALHKPRFMIYCAMQNTDMAGVDQTNCELLVFRLRLVTIQHANIPRGSQHAFVNMRPDDGPLAERAINQYGFQPSL